MKLLVFTNLEVYGRTGLLASLGLSTNLEDSYAIKGVKAGKSCDSITSLAEAANYDILICHQFGVGIAQVVSLLSTDHDWAFVFHKTGGSKLWEVYHRMTQNAIDRKLIYRYEHSGEGPTFDLLRQLGPLPDTEPLFKARLEDYMSRFDVDALPAFIDDILDDTYLADGPTQAQVWREGGPIPYLWRLLFEKHSTLPELIEQHYNSESKEHADELFCKIRDVLEKKLKF